MTVYPLAAVSDGDAALVTATQGWAVVAGVGGRVRIVGVVIGAAGTAQGRLVAAALVVELALVLDARQAGFDVVELAGGDDVVGLGRHDGGNLLLGVGDAVGRL